MVPELLPFTRPLRPQPARSDRRAKLPHRALPQLVLPSHGGARQDRCRGQARTRCHRGVACSRPRSGRCRWVVSREALRGEQEHHGRFAPRSGEPQGYAGLRRRPVAQRFPEGSTLPETAHFSKSARSGLFGLLLSTLQQGGFAAFRRVSRTRTRLAAMLNAVENLTFVVPGGLTSARLDATFLAQGKTTG